MSGRNGSNGTPSATTTGALVHLSEKLVRALPPAFLLLVILNVVFLGVVGWVFQHGSEQRNVLLTKIVENCLLNKAPQ